MTPPVHWRAGDRFALYVGKVCVLAPRTPELPALAYGWLGHAMMGLPIAIAPGVWIEDAATLTRAAGDMLAVWRATGASAAASCVLERSPETRPAP